MNESPDSRETARASTAPLPTVRRPLAGWLAGTFSLGWLALWFFGLNLRALAEPDEARYAEVAREMFVSGNWLTPKLDGFNFFDKPALQYWATSICYHLFGVHEWTARLWVALTAMATIAVTGWAGKRLYGTATGWLAAIVLGSTLLFFAGGHLNSMAMGVAAFMSIAVCVFLVANFDPQAAPHRVGLNLVGWASLALAVLSKGLIGLVFPTLALLAFMLWERDWRIWRRMTMGWGLALAAVIAAPWFIAISLRHPDFFNYFFIQQQFTRFLVNEYDRYQPWWFFLAVTLAGLFPWVAFLPLSRRGWRELVAGSAAERFLLCWIAVILVFFSVSHSKLPLYILPIFPALALLIARRVSALTRGALAWRLLGISVLALAAVVATLTLHPSTRHLSRHTELHPALLWLAAGLGLLAVVAVLCAFMLKRRWRPVVAMSVLGACSLLVWQVLFAGNATLAASLSAKPVAELMRPHLRTDTEVFTVHAYQRGLSFYLQRLVTVVDEQPDDIRPGIASRPTGVITNLGAFEGRWRATRRAMAVVDPHLLPELESAKLPMIVVGQAPSGLVIMRPASPAHSSP
jgi:4-amino-4-deoxy-L-arabinose transferase-like glycosyltransferase